MESNTAQAPDKPTKELVLRNKRKPPFVERHLSHLVTAGIGLIAAVVTLFAAMWGASIGAEAAVKAADMQNQAEDMRRSQDRRDVAYKDYLNAANRYFYAWDDLASTPKPVPVETVAAKMPELLKARYEYQGQINEVFVYGSGEAWSAHENVARTLPSAVAGSDIPDFRGQPNNAAFGAAFNAFLEVRCREVTALPRSSCS
jgi:hypothetical protein